MTDRLTYMVRHAQRLLMLMLLVSLLIVSGQPAAASPWRIPGGTATSGPAEVYPFQVYVTLAPGQPVTDVNVTLNGLTHSHPADLDVLLVSPSGIKSLIMSDQCSDFPLSNATITIDDDAGTAFPMTGPCESFSYLPGNNGADDPMPAPAPAGPYENGTLSVFNAETQSGYWSLYIADDVIDDIGSINGVTITVSPSAATPILNLDAPPNNTLSTNGQVAFGGWAVNPGAGAGNGPGVSQVRFSLSSCTDPAAFSRSLTISRPDVAAALGLDASYNVSGWAFNFSSSTSGHQTMRICAQSSLNAGVYSQQQERTIDFNLARINIDGPANNAATTSSTVNVGGWAFDRAGGNAGPGVDLITIFRGTQCSGTSAANAPLNIARADVRSAFGLDSTYTNLGWAVPVTLPNAGPNTLTACARSTVGNVAGQYRAQRTITVRRSDTRMAIDQPFNNQIVNSNQVTVSGWAFDLGAGANGPGISNIAIREGNGCGGPLITGAQYGLSRPDVAAVYGLNSTYNNSGFISVINRPQGLSTFTVCVRSSVTGTVTAQMTRTVWVRNPRMNVDSPTEQQFVLSPITMRGWAFDNTAGAGGGPGIDAVYLYVGNQCSGTQLGSALINQPRPDVAATFGLDASYNNSGWQVTFSRAPGSYTVSVCGYDFTLSQFVIQQVRTVNVSGGIQQSAPTNTPEPTVPAPTLTATPTAQPTGTPTATLEPTLDSTGLSTDIPTDIPTVGETATLIPTDIPTMPPTDAPTATIEPSLTPTLEATPIPTETPTDIPPTATFTPTATSTSTPSSTPTATPTTTPEPETTVPA